MPPVHPDGFESYDGGDPFTEASRFQALAGRIMWVQKRLQEKAGGAKPLRAFHAKIRLGVENATLAIRSDLPAEYRVGFFQPDQHYSTTVRISNASGSVQPDAKKDLRGVGLRVAVSGAETHDFLMTNGPVSHARDGREFVAFAEAMAGSWLKLPFRFLFNLGPFTTFRMFRTLARQARAIDSLTTETYWSRGAVLWGEQAVRVRLIPADLASQPAPSREHPDYLRSDLADRLRQGPLAFDLCVQPFIDQLKTPIENAAVEWRESDSAFVTVARLTIPQQDVDAIEGRAAAERVDLLAFNPWHTTNEFRPLGNINRARKAVYAASSGLRQEHRFVDEPPLRNRFFGALARGTFNLINTVTPWHKLPANLAVLNLDMFRQQLRRENLSDTEDRDAPPTVQPVPIVIPEEARTARTADGSFTDLSVPRMGAADDAGPPEYRGSTFGRTVPLSAVRVINPSDAPNPVEISDRLLARREFLPAKSLNMLAAAWIQFQVHDWVEHPRYRKGQPGATTTKVPLPTGKTWQNTVGGPSESYMEFFNNVRRVTHDPRLANIPVFENINTPWWDGGQIYGYTPADATRLRAKDGATSLASLRLENGFLPDNPDPLLSGIEDTGFNENWWLGSSLMHTLFANEHNAVVAALRAEYRGWDEEALFRTARLVISALIAKIHTVEWTPAILATKPIEISLNANWSGAPKDWLSQLSVWLIDTHSLKGIPGSFPDHHGVPYSLSEEFVSVYRMHPLIPDDYRFFSHEDGSHRPVVLSAGGPAVGSPDFSQIQGRNTGGLMHQLGLADVAYSFGVAHPGAITLQNYPYHLRNFARANGERIDLSVIDIVRDRARGVPLYNEFRHYFHRPRVSDFSEITSNAEWAREMKAVYGTVDRIDTMVGLLAEAPPAGFGFSDTAFRHFILSASRRLQSDRFLTVDYRPEVYSHLGLDWIARTGMKEIIERHCPGTSRSLQRNASAFAPWRPVGQG